MSNMQLPIEGFLCSGSNPDYRYESTIHNGIVSVVMWFDNKKHTFTTDDPLTVAITVNDYYEKNKKA